MLIFFTQIIRFGIDFALYQSADAIKIRLKTIINNT